MESSVSIGSIQKAMMKYNIEVNVYCRVINYSADTQLIGR